MEWSHAGRDGPHAHLYHSDCNEARTEEGSVREPVMWTLVRSLLQ
jgi:hypothetical protein